LIEREKRKRFHKRTIENASWGVHTMCKANKKILTLPVSFCKVFQFICCFFHWKLLRRNVQACINHPVKMTLENRLCAYHKSNHKVKAINYKLCDMSLVSLIDELVKKLMMFS
jgi:hypothetical protein